MFSLILAQADAVKPDEVAGLAERLNKGGVPVIALFFALMFAVAMIVLFRMLLGKSGEFTALEQSYRATIESKAAQDKADAEARLKDAKQEAASTSKVTMDLMQERLKAEKESDVVLANAVHVIEANTKFAEKVDHRLDSVDDVKRSLEDVKRLLTDLTDRFRRVEDTVRDQSQRKPA